MHSIRRATLRAATTHASRAVVATPRLALAAKTTGSNLLLSSAAVLSRSFVATRWLANQVDSVDQGEGISEDHSAGLTEGSESATPEGEGQAGPYVRGQDTPYGLFVRNLVFDANEEHLMDAFSKYGEITKTSIARDVRGLSRGYAFVFFTNAEDMNKAAAGANGSFWHGRRIHASPRLKPTKDNRSQGEAREARERLPLAERVPTKSLYIGNIPYETTDVELNKLFRSLDNVTDVRIAVDRSTGWPRGFAHADFSSEEAALAAGQKLEDMTLLGRQLRIDFSQGKRAQGNDGERRISTSGEDEQ
ncbi:nucleic acid-binding protein [Gaeumannomyces tritici R3-111a-1]|uniref:Nucleic acid-binding protein n=1 Tax=Gaeumannomyces tritici (strain R3-111a-1) TaxID=644352 RepID=J3NSB6_GAET3|nr:nucleic acid-binding protein [Gaeumannomyces tritici R3-111a-1]EJT79073.1 nucleic acid-binding protein [Gaeumannomyces tritici R3-111a-1]